MLGNKPDVRIDGVRVTGRQLSDPNWQISQGAKIRGKYGVERGNQILRAVAESNDGTRYPMYGCDD